MGVAIIAAFVLPDFPATTSSVKFSEAEKKLAIKRLQFAEHANATEEQPKLGHWAAFKIAMKSWRTWLFVVGYMVSFEYREHLANFVLILL